MNPLSSDLAPAPAGRVLLVEDDPDGALFLTRVLTRRGGLDVTHVPDPAAALGMVARQAWDVVVTDYDLPRMTGADLVAALRAADPGLSVVLVSARDMVPASSGDHHPDAHLAKPVPPAELLATVESLIARKRH